MNEIFRIPITKEKLRAIPADDRNLLLLASHAVNQLSVLRKVMIFSLNYESESQLENLLSAAQSQTQLRFLFAALAETWEMVTRPVHQKLIGKDYHADLGIQGQASLENLKKHFGKSNLLHKLRNSIVYHYPDAATLDAAFEDVPEDEDWSWYSANTINNSFYLASDLVISAGILKLTGEADTQRAFEKVMGIVIPVSNDVTDLLLLIMRAIVSRHLGDGGLNPHRGSGIEIKDAPSISKVSLPFFTSDPEE